MPSTTDNPLREGVRLERTAEPCTVVIFGASGDLTKRKARPGALSPDAGATPAGRVRHRRVRAHADEPRRVSRQDERRDRSLTPKPRRVDEAGLGSFAQGHLLCLRGHRTTPRPIRQLRELLDQIDRERGTAGNRVFYLSTSPSLYAEAIQQLGAAGLAKPEGKGWTRIIIEKPFGHDLASAKELNHEVARMSSTKSRSIASITISAKRPCRT